MFFILIILVGAGMVAIEKLWPAGTQPVVHKWWLRIIAVNAVQAALVLLGGITWDRWMQGASLIELSDHFSLLPAALIGYIVVTFIYYFWHRIRHESSVFWRLCHQLHHSPRRMEVVMSFYKHPVEILLNSLISGAIAYPLLGCSPECAALITGITAVSEFFYHWNVRTPRWFGYLFQRPESHRVHHKRDYHTNNYSDLPVWDMMFGTFENPKVRPDACGFSASQEDRIEDMLTFRDAIESERRGAAPRQFLPTCIGCSKRWACGMPRAEASTDVVKDKETTTSEL
ncbi:MAG: sterol desaturase/sphingolipid hydroxylase (fatty acid hydroxylase superfamily) [Verrucomicrobiales bacterium]|jgi:sterol desaturase/sphingolipid hydroxylase (fatty acid hydroxylase superfamily)